MTLRCSSFLLIATAAAFAADLPWYMQETRMTSDGRLTLLEKPWWPRAKALPEGGSFTLDLNHDGRTDTLVRRLNGDIVEAIDDSGRAQNIWNESSTAYVVSFKGTGLVDRMIVYIDNDGDGKADEMELRHYQDGYLRYAWFAENYDRDGVRVFDLKNWSYAGNNARSKFRGNVQIYLNKYDAAKGVWVPLSECPFAFWDSDHDGWAEEVLRVSAAPLNSNTGPDTDYANNYNYMWSPRAAPLETTGNMNVRLSYNIEPQPHDPSIQPHFNFGFTLAGAQPYSYPKMEYTNSRRRPPQTVVRLPWQDGLAMALHYPAVQTAFTWDEARISHRWEGQFWTYERLYVSNTGGPTERWNMRREYFAGPSSERQLYYSEVDKRYHLFGATEAWIEAGHLVGDSKDLEIRAFDSDSDGYLDTWQVFTAGNPVPARVSRVQPRTRRVTLDREALTREYNETVLPSAIDENRQLIVSMKQFAASPLAQKYEEEADRSSMLERRRYCLDIARELLLLEVRGALYTRNASGPYPQGQSDPARYREVTAGSLASGYTLGDTLKYWKNARQIEVFLDRYAAGRFLEARDTLNELAKDHALLDTPSR